MAVDTVREKFDIPGYAIKKRVELQVGRDGESGEKLLIKDSEGHIIAFVDLVGIDAIYNGEPRIRVTFPENYYIQIASGLRSVILTPAKMKTPSG